MGDKSSEPGKCTLFVGNLPTTATNGDLEKEFSEIGPIKRCFIVKDKRIGFVTFALREDAHSAIEKVKTLQGKTLNLSFAKDRVSTKPQNDDKKADIKSASKSVNKVENKYKAGNNQAKPQQKRKSFGKMVVRNLSFKVTEKDIRNVFEKYGKVIDVDLPKKPDGKLKGFGFVRMENEQVTTNAIAGINSQEILGRPVAVDWAISQKEYKIMKSQESVAKDNGKDSFNCNIGMEKNKHAKTKSDTKTSKTKGQIKNTSDNTDTTDLEEDSSDADSDDDDAEEDSSDADSDDDAEEDMTASGDGEYDDMSDQDENSSETGAKKGKKRENSERYSDIKEGKTLFIRNISFDTNQEQLAKAFSKFGKLQYARICVDSVTEHSKGTGFVKFVNKQSADDCISKTVMQSEDGGITLDGHKLWVSIALSKDDTKKIDEDKTKKKKDNRNLYLAREGLIRPGTLASEGVSQQDMAKRMHLEERKGRMLRNLHMFYSENRLTIHNIPLSMSEKTLRGIFKKAGGSGAILTEVKIMRSMKKFDASGVGQSKGFGFVRFKEHEHALTALRATNNNPDIFTPSSRPIVEFTLENKAALKAKERRLENSQLRNKQIRDGGKPEKGDRPNNASSNNKKFKSTAPSSDITEVSKSFVGTKSESLDSAKSKTLPSHFGPKIRHKKRPGAEAAKALKNTKRIRKRKREEMLIAQTKRRNRKEMPPPKKIKHSEDNVDRLVNNYQKKFMSRNKKEGEKSKWFKN